MKQTDLKKRDVFVVDGTRTPFLKAMKPNIFSASDLAVSSARALLARLNLPATLIDEVIIGCVMPSPKETNPGRGIALRLGCGEGVPAWTVQRNCASGLQAIDSALQSIQLNRSELVIAGGTEAMSRAPLLFSEAYVSWLMRFGGAKTWQQKLQSLLKFRPKLLKPVIALVQGLSDSIVACNMGETAGEVAHLFGLTRSQIDQFAFESQQRALHAQKSGFFDEEITPLFDYQGKALLSDDGVRADSSLEKLNRLKPVFDKPYGAVTAGNSSQITDGAATLLLATEAMIKKYNLPVLGRVIDVAWAGLDPKVMGLGPVHAISKLLTTHALSFQDIDYWEINEAFAGQVLGCLKAFQDKKYCQEKLGLDKVWGEIPLDRLNVDGGAIALGHPVGASGARISLHLLNVLKRNKAKLGVASLCIGGGQGGAILMEQFHEGAL